MTDGHCKERGNRGVAAKDASSLPLLVSRPSWETERNTERRIVLRLHSQKITMQSYRSGSPPFSLLCTEISLSAFDHTHNQCSHSEVEKIIKTPPHTHTHHCYQTGKSDCKGVVEVLMGKNIDIPSKFVCE